MLTMRTMQHVNICFNCNYDENNVLTMVLAMLKDDAFNVINMSDTLC